MAEETIYCPSCNHKLRVPEEMLGQTVQCPLCRVVFVAPTRGGAAPAPPQVLPASAPLAPPAPVPPHFLPEGGSDAEAERVLLLVRQPAASLLMIGVLGWLASAYRAVHAKLQGIDGTLREMEEQRRALPMLAPRGGPDVNEILTPELVYSLQISMGLFFMVLCTVIIIGAASMMRLRYYRLALLSCILAMVNFNECCCLLGLPIGIWALRVLLQPEVRRSFES